MSFTLACLTAVDLILFFVYSLVHRGVYLSCLLYHEDKVLVTNEDYLPVVEIDDTYPKEMLNDFHWFYKIAFAWKDLKWFKDDLEKSTNNSVSFRMKLIQAVTQMQVSQRSRDKTRRVVLSNSLYFK